MKPAAETQNTQKLYHLSIAETPLPCPTPEDPAEREYEIQLYRIDDYRVGVYDARNAIARKYVKGAVKVPKAVLMMLTKRGERFVGSLPPMLEGTQAVIVTEPMKPEVK